ncbi:hypothetical protein LguiA_023259 [Lonicera macranthoides]
MGDRDMSSGLNLNTEVHVESASASVDDPQTYNPNDHCNNPHALPPAVFTNDHDRASDLLISVLVCSELYKPKIIELAVGAAEELTQMATEQQPLWSNEVLNKSEYKRKFAPLDSTLEEIVRMISVGDPTDLPNLGDNFHQLPRENEHEPILSMENSSSALQTEASRAIGLVLMQPMDLVDMFMDVDQWLIVFSNIVTKATVLGVLSAGETPRNPNGALQVMSAEFHVPSPLVCTREFYFARYCKQLAENTWLVVDFSLDSIFPNPIARFQRRPSGCFIQRTQNGLTKVTWVEHNEVDNGWVHKMFRPLIASGFAFAAMRWLATLERQCDRLSVLMEDNSALQGGRRSLLQLAHRMSRSFNTIIRASTENLWRPLPTGSEEEVLMKTNFNLDDPGSPSGVSLTFATSLWLPIPPKEVFEFLRCGSSRNKWDILSYGQITRDIAHFSTGRHPANCVSIVLVEAAPNETIIHYLQESYTDSNGYYIVYAPIDIPAMNVLFDGGNPGKVAILASGFTILPVRPTSQTSENYTSILTIAFQIVEEQLVSPEYVPPHSVSMVYNIINQTVSLIKSALIPIVG